VPGNFQAYEHFAYNSATIGIIKALGYEILLFNYRGVGKSESVPSPKGVRNDLKAAIDYAKNTLKYSEENISVLGRSLGGAIATKTLSEMQPSKIRLLNVISFSSISDVIEGFPIFRIMKVFLKILVKIISWDFNVVEDWNKIKGKKWVVTANDDEVLGEKGKLSNSVNCANTICVRGDHNIPLAFSTLRQILQ